MPRWMATALAVVATLPLLHACGGDGSTDDEPDCSGRIRYEDTIYRLHNEVNPDAPRGEQLGSAEVIDCGDGSSASKVDEAVIFSVRGVASSIAVMVSAREWQGVYVAEDVADDVPPSEWPSPLQER